MRRAVSASPALLAERRRLKGKQKLPPQQTEVPGAVWAAALVGLFWGGGVATAPGGLEAFLALQGGLAACATWLHARKLLKTVFCGELEIFVSLPASDPWLFDRFRSGARWGQAAWLIPLSVAAGAAGYAGWKQGLEPQRLGWVLSVLTGLQWLGVVGLAPLMAWRAPHWAQRAWLATGGLFALLVGGLMLLKTGGGDVAVSRALGALGWACPLSWSGLGCAPLLRGGSLGWLLALTPGLALAALVGWSIPGWRRAYRLGPLLDPTATSPEMAVEGHVDNRMVLESEFNEELVENPTLEPWVRSQVRESVGRSVTLAVQAGEWRAPPRFEGGVNGVLGRVLSPRERLVAGLLQSDLDSWGSSLRWALILCGVGGGVAVSATLPEWVSYLLLILAALIALPLQGGSWTGLEFAATTGGYAPLFAFFPVTLREVTRTILKINATRLLLYLPFFVASGAVLGLHSRGWGFGAEVAAETWLLLAALQPGTLALRLNDRLVSPPGAWWARLLKLPLAIGGVCAVLAAGAAVFALPAPFNLAAALLSGVLSWAVLKLTLRWLVRADLVRQTLPVS